jgi:hypothetical protein
MSYLNEDLYENAAEYIRTISNQVQIEGSQPIPTVNEIENLENLLELLIGSDNSDKYADVQKFLDKYRV